MGIGFRELIIILIIGLVIFGAKRLRTIGSDLGAAVRGFKKAVSESEEAADMQARDLQRLSAPGRPAAEGVPASKASEQVG